MNPEEENYATKLAGSLVRICKSLGLSDEEMDRVMGAHGQEPDIYPLLNAYCRMRYALDHEQEIREAFEKMQGMEWPQFTRCH